MAVPTADGMETRLEVFNIQSGKSQILRFGPQQHVSDITWTADDQLVVARAKMEPLKARPSSQGELYTTDVRGKNPVSYTHLDVYKRQVAQGGCVHQTRRQRIPHGLSLIHI